MGSLQSLRSLHYISDDKLWESGLEPDVYGRGHDRVFGAGARVRTQHEARKALERVRRFRTRVRPGEYVEVDVYGRGDSRVFGRGAYTENRREAYAQLRRVQSRKEREEYEGQLRKAASGDAFSPPIGEVSGSLAAMNNNNQKRKNLVNAVSGKSVMSDATSMVSDVPQSRDKEMTYEEYGDEALVTKVNDDSDEDDSEYESTTMLGDMKSTEAEVASETPSFFSSLPQDGSTFHDSDFGEAFPFRDTARSRTDDYSERRISVGSQFVNPSRETSDAATVEDWDMRNSFGEENPDDPSSADLTGSLPGFSHRRLNRGTGTPGISADMAEFSEEPILQR